MSQCLLAYGTLRETKMNRRRTGLARGRNVTSGALFGTELVEGVDGITREVRLIDVVEWVVNLNIYKIT